MMNSNVAPQEAMHACFRLPLLEGEVREISDDSLSQVYQDLELLSEREIKALHDLTMLLTCGEESAVLVFTNLSRMSTGKDVSETMMGIAEDERKHERYLQTVRFACERRQPLLSEKNSAGTRKKRRFFLKLETSDNLVHLSRVASLDGCVTIVLAELLHSSVLSKVNSIRDLMQEIRQDESRHVRLTRDFVLSELGGAAILSAERKSVCAAFLDLLGGHEDALSDLGVSWERIEKKLEGRSN